MPTSCCEKPLHKVLENTDLTIALAGNPNVGKSAIFNRLTGMGVVTANYPGKTVELNIAATSLEGMRIGIIDLPGTYALRAVSEDQWVARRGLLDGRPQVVVVILDATNLARNLYLALQLLELEIPVVVSLNLVDQAEKRGLRFDTDRLAARLGAPVVETVATRGEGLDMLMRTAVEVAREWTPEQNHRPVPFVDQPDHPLPRFIEMLADSGLDMPYPVGPQALGTLLIEGDPEFRSFLEEAGAHALLEEADLVSRRMEEGRRLSARILIARERHRLAAVIAHEVELPGERKVTTAEKLWRLTIRPLTGLPLLVVVLGTVFGMLFWIGGMLGGVFANIWQATASPAIGYVIQVIFGTGMVARILAWGPDAGIEAALEVGIPYVLTFYLMLAVMEDTGYLNSVAFLSDRLMHKVGLHGRAVIPLVSGMGCNVPAVIGTRVLTSWRERILASTLIVLVPCSARTAVIMGGVAATIGPWPAIVLFLVNGLVIVGVGLGLAKLLPGEPTGLVMEMFPFRMPSAITILKKTWVRFKDFVFVATPIILGGSLLLGTLYETGAIWWFTAPLAPVVEGILGLPSVSGLTLLFAVLRKELALQLLVTFGVAKYGQGASSLLYFMAPAQLFVYALVNTLYVPCIATMAVLGRELGWRRAVAVIAGTVSLAVAVGGLARLVLMWTGWLS